MRKLLVNSLLVAVIVLAYCKGKEPGTPPVCEILSFSAGGKEWTINGLNITALFPKETNVSNLSPIILVSEGASINPGSGVPQDFSNDKTVTYTLTCKDGKTKTYTAKATVSASN